MSEAVKVDFKDGSFLLFESTEDKKVNVIMCGRKDANSVTMSSSFIDKDQVNEIMGFLNDWLRKQ